MARKDDPSSDAPPTPEDDAPAAAPEAKPEEKKESAAAAEPAPKDEPAAKDEPAPGDAPPEPVPVPSHKPVAGAAWGEPVARFERRWTWLETRLITFVLVWQLASMVLWVFLGGLASPLSAGNPAGMVFRAVTGAVALGIGAWFGAKRLDEVPRRAVTVAAIVLGAAIAPLWRTVGVDYFDNLRGWLQEGSTLTLMGGLRGLATRLTLWLALLGASLATAAGKHIHIDVVFRFLPKRFRLPAAVVNFSAVALMCFAAVWGFFDHVSQDLGAKADQPAGAKLSLVMHELSEHTFLTRKQMGLDLRSLPHVLSGDRYDRWMTAPQWNAWVEDAGFGDRYRPEQVKNLIIPADAPPHAPLVISPDGEPTRGILEHDLNFVFPFGLLVIGLRFLLRVLLALSGHIDLDPDAAHQEELAELTHAPERT